MKKLIAYLLVLSMFAGNVAKADEGMWIPSLLKNYNYEQMKAKGLKLTPEQLYDVNHNSLKDAIVWFNGGCTGEIISSEGLVLTNHHCGYDAIASLSTKEDNILDNGFWAKNKGEERAKAGMWVSIVQRIDDVSDRILPMLAGVEEKNRPDSLQKIYKKIIAETTKGTHYEAQIREMFKGNAYYLFVFEKFTDIRLVGTPPQSVGKFGGDPDNWMWPRHTGDFSMFRIYAGKDNKPAAYSTNNVPYKPKHHLPVSMKGINPGDYAMIMGFPGRTNRYEFSQGIELAVEKINPTIVKLRAIRLQAWKEVMDKSVSDRLLLSADYASVANYWKYFIGQTEQLKRLKVVEYKKNLELDFYKFAIQNKEYANVLPNIEKAYVVYKPYALQRTYLSEGILGVTANSAASSFYPYIKASKENKDKEQIEKALKAAIAATEDAYSSFFASADEKILAQILEQYYNDIPEDQHPSYMNKIMRSKGKTTLEKCQNFAQKLYAKSIFGSKERMLDFCKHPSYKKLATDPCYEMVEAFYENYLINYKPKVDAFVAAIAPESRAYVKGLQLLYPNKTFYPDANSSLRLTYGSVQGYDPKDAIHYDYYTTLDGVIEKYDPTNFEFQVPQKLLTLHKFKDYGDYKMDNGQMPVAFITNNDITGGNSGSPVIDGEGNLIGLAFDGNWEAMSGDIVFDEKFKRTINVDIRYVLFLIDKLGEAKHIVDEMTLVRKK